MDQLNEWIKKKLSEGFSKEQIKKALSDEGFDSNLVDLVLQNNKKTISRLKNRLIFLTIVLSFLVISLLIVLLNIEHNSQPLVDKRELETNISFKNQSTFNLFLDKGFFVTTDKIPFKIVNDDLIFTNLSNKSLDIILLKISKYDESVDEVINFIEDSINSSYNSKFLKNSKELTYKNHRTFNQEYVILERNFRKIIKNNFIDFENKTLLISYKCNELDKPKCDELLVEATEHISLV